MNALVISNSIQSTLRLAALRSLALLDTPPEAPFDRLTRVASSVTDTPIALISLIDAHRQFFKSIVGLPEPWASMRQMPLSHSFCQYVIMSEDVLVINDCRESPLVSHNPAVTDLGAIAYLGVPLITQDGYAVGSFCLIDHRPRTWSRDEILLASEIARIAVVTIELRTELMKSLQTEVMTSSAHAEAKGQHQYDSLLRNIRDTRAQINEFKSSLCSPDRLPALISQLNALDANLSQLLIPEPAHPIPLSGEFFH